MHVLQIISLPRRAARIKKIFSTCKYEVDELRSAEAALTRLEQRARDYDLVVFDTTDPDIDPELWCATVRQYSQIPIIAITKAANADDLIVRLLLEHVDDFVRLPVESAELFARAQAVLRRPRKVAAKRLVVGELILEPQYGGVRYNGQDIHLSKKEASLLFYLAEQYDKVVRREDIIGHAWEVPGATASNTLDAHIRNLRAKLPENAACVIETVRGVGYRLTQLV